MCFKKIIIKIIFSLCVIFFTLLFIELIIRIFWHSYPDNYLSIFTPFYQPSNNYILKYEHIPNWSGYATGVKIKINKIGLRNKELEKNKNKKRILLIGDSMIFGFGLQDKYLISTQLEKLLNENGFNDIEIINAGVCGYNLLQNIENLKKYYSLIKPDFVFISFIHNDFDDLFCDTDFFLPSFTSTYFNEINRNSFIFKLYNFFINEDLLKNKRYKEKGLRTFLTNNSALYLFVSLKLKKLLLHYSGYEVANPYFKYFPDSFTFKKLVFDNIDLILKNFLEFQQKENFDYSFLLLNNHFINNYIEIKFMELLEKNKINYLNFSPFLPDKKTYYEKYTLGWDPHPNKYGALLYAKLFFDSLNFYDFIKTNNFYYFQKNNYSAKSKIYRQNLIIKKEDIKLKTRIDFNEDLLNYPMYGIYNDVKLLQNQEGKIVSKYFSTILEKGNNSIFFVKGKKINNDDLKIIIRINDNIYDYEIKDKDFNIEIPINNIDSKNLEIFIETKNPLVYNKNLISFIIKEIGLK